LKENASGSIEPTASVKVAGLGALTDRDISDHISALWENVEELPLNIQTLLYLSQEKTAQGESAYLLLAGWALGRLQYAQDNPWMDPKHTWFANNDIN